MVERGRRKKRDYIHKLLSYSLELELELEEGSSCGDGISFAMQWERDEYKTTS
jgi:hypothetical protein